MKMIIEYFLNYYLYTNIYLFDNIALMECMNYGRSAKIFKLIVFKVLSKFMHFQMGKQFRWK